jgi:hypothetical protein
MNPKGAAGLSKIRRLPDWPNTLGRRLGAAWFATWTWEKAREGTRRARARSTVREAHAPKGGSGVLEPWPRDQAGRAQVPWSPAERSTLYSSEFEVWMYRRRRGAADVATRPGLTGPKGLCESKPHERQRAQRAREAGGRANRRGGEKPRGRSVPGEASPGDTALSGRCRWRGSEPQEGRSSPAGLVKALWPRP